MKQKNGKKNPKLRNRQKPVVTKRPAPPRIPPGDLNPKQALFVREYLVDLNATQAAIRAGYTQKAARQAGAQLLTNNVISAAIEKAVAERAQRVEITADRVLAELGRIGFSDLRACFDDQNRLLDPKSWPDHVAAAIASVEIVRERVRTEDEVTVQETTHKIRTWDKTKALELIARHLKMLTDNVNVKGDVTVTQKVAEDVPRMSDVELAKATALNAELMALIRGGKA